jgi:decaprenylphospho-beta-D-erythro-pentofuranosid-2-ulose 2-reductase
MDDAPFATTADAVAADVVDGLRRGAHTVWSPAKLRWVFTVMRHLPRPIWRQVAARR